MKGINFELPNIIAPQTVNLDIKDIAKAAGITQEVLVTRHIGNTTEETKEKEYNTVHFHTGRHSYCMKIVDMAAGKPHAEKWISNMMGHASAATTWKYMNRRASSHDRMFDEIMSEEIEKKKTPKPGRIRK
jgi:integrase